MRLRIHLAIFLVLSFLSSGASAADYTWRYGSGASIYLTPLAACEAEIAKFSNLRYVSLTKVSDSQFTCSFKHYAKPDVLTGPVFRDGVSCPAGSVYNSLIGVCEVPDPTQGELCADQTGIPAVNPSIKNAAGECVRYLDADLATSCKFLGKYSAANQTVSVAGVITPADSTAPDATPNVVPPGGFNHPSGCEVSIASSKCSYQPGRREGDRIIRGGGTCQLDVSYTGNVAATIPPDNGQAHKEDVCLDAAKCNLPLPKNLNDSKPCNYATGSDGSQSCTSEKFTGKEGQTQCGMANGVFKCSDDMHKAVGNGLSIATKVKTETTADGKTKITKTDVLTETKCKGVFTKDCTTGVTTSTTTTVKDGTGQTESATGTCTGPQCPDKNTNPDGDGDGFGDCTGDDCGDEGGEGPTTPEFDEVPSYGETVATFYDRVSDSPVADAAYGLHAPGGGECYAPSTETYLGTFTMDGHCQLVGEQISLIKLIAKTLWALAAFWIFIG